MLEYEFNSRKKMHNSIQYVIQEGFSDKINYNFDNIEI